MDALDAIRDTIDTLLELDDAEEATVLADRILAELAKMRPCAESAYLQGLVAYEHPKHATRPSLRSTVEASMTLCLELAPRASTAALAWLGLMHSAYDAKAWKLAAHRLEQCVESALHPYLRAKAIEMRLCIRIRRFGLKGAIDDLSSCLEALADFDRDDIVPQELARVLREYGPVVDFEVLAAYATFAKELDRMSGFDNWLHDIVKGLSEGGQPT